MAIHAGNDCESCGTYSMISVPPLASSTVEVSRMQKTENKGEEDVEIFRSSCEFAMLQPRNSSD